MLRAFNFNTIPTVKKEKNVEYSRILSAAVINEGFKVSLLLSPMDAVSRGYFGESFNVNAQDREKLNSIHAYNLVDFATQLSQL